MKIGKWRGKDEVEMMASLSLFDSLVLLVLQRSTSISQFAFYSADVLFNYNNVETSEVPMSWKTVNRTFT